MPGQRRSGGLSKGNLFDTNIKATSIDEDIFSDQEAISEAADGDLILVLDVSETPDKVKYITKNNLIGGSLVSLTNNTNNYLLTGTGSAVNGEANLQFDGTILTVESGEVNIDKSSGDPHLSFQIGDTDKFTIGVDDSDSDKFKIDTGGTVGGATKFTLDSSGNVTIAGDLTVSGSSTATVATTVTITDNESTNEDNAIVFTSGGDVDGGNLGLESDGNLIYNPSTGRLTATQLAGTLQTAAQTNVTSLGTLSALTIDNVAIDGATIGHTSDTDLITLADGNVTIAGELDLTTLDVSGNADIDGTLEADAITVDGTALDEFIADTIGGMVTSNTESGITVAYQDGDNTLDFTVGTLNQDTTGNADTATEATNITATANNSANETVYLTFVDGATGTQGIETDTGLNYNPSTGVLTTTSVTGNLTGNVTGNTSGTAATVTEAAQSAITSLGTLTTLTVDNVIVNGTTIGHTSDTDLITLADGNVTIAGELDLTTLDVSGDADIDGTLEADAITVGGTSLAEFIADTAGAMFTSNTETNITATYQDADNTIDLVVGTLNQDTTGTAAIATTVTITDNESTNEENAVIFAAGGDVDGGNLGLESDGNLTYNPSTGTLTATTFSGSVSGSISTATESTTITVTANNSTDETVYPLFVDGATGAQGAETDTGLTYNPSSGLLTISGELDAGSLDISGNADIDGTLEADAITVDGTTLAEYISDTVGAMVTSNTESGITVAYQDADNTLDFTVGTLNQDTTGTAAIATTVTITDNENTNENNAIIFTSGGDLDGGNLGLESDGDFHYNPSTGTLTATTFSGAFSGTVTDATNVTVSANNSTDETVYLTFVDGATGAQGIESDTGLTYNPSSGVLTATQFTGAVSGNASTATLASTVTITDNESTDEDNAIIFTAGGDVDGGNLGLESDGNLIYNPSTGRLTATQLAGALQTASQTAITGVGTITTGTWEGTDVAVAHGGTGASSLTDGGVLLGSGTGAITAMAVLADGEMIVGDGTTDPVAESGATLRTSIGVGTGDSPQFTAIQLGHASDTTIARSGSGAITVEGTQVLLAGAQTGITTILNASTKIGRDADNLIDFATTDNKIILRVNGVNEVELVENALSPVTSDGVALGTTSLMWSDLFLASGSVINFNNGDVTLTHSGNTLTVAGGTLAAAAITGTTIDASTDFTIGDTVITNGVITDSSGLQLAANLDINGTADISGDLTLSGGADGALQFTNAGENSIKIPDNQASALIIEEANNAYITFVTTDSSEAITIAKATTFSAGIADSGTISAGTWNGTAIDGGYINDNIISGQAEITSGLAAADELLYSDAGTVKRIGLDNFVELAPALATEDAIADGDYLLFLDGGASGNMNKEAVHDLATLFAGAGMTATSSVLNVIGGDGITANANDVAITAAQTTITSVLNASLVVGRDADNDIDFTTDNTIRFRASGEDQLTLTDGALTPSSNAIVDLGTDALEFKDAYFDGTVEADALTIGGTNIVSGSLITTLGTISAGTWQGTAIASGYIAADAITGAKIADDAINSEHYTDGSIDTAHIADDQVTLAKMAGLARGKLIYGDSSGNPAALAVGSANQVLTHDGTDLAWADAGGGGGIAEAQEFRQTASYTGNGDLTSNWEISDNTGQTSLTGGNAVSQSSGIFSFAATGYYLIMVNADVENASTDGTAEIRTMVTNNDGTDGYPVYTSATTGASGSGATRGTATSNLILDITNTSNQKVKFNTSSFGGTGIGSTTVSNSTFIFIRLGDT